MGNTNSSQIMGSSSNCYTTVEELANIFQLVNTKQKYPYPINVNDLLGVYQTENKSYIGIQGPIQQDNNGSAIFNVQPNITNYNGVILSNPNISTLPNMYMLLDSQSNMLIFTLNFPLSGPSGRSQNQVVAAGVMPNLQTITFTPIFGTQENWTKLNFSQNTQQPQFQQPQSQQQNQPMQSTPGPTTTTTIGTVQATPIQPTTITTPGVIMYQTTPNGPTPVVTPVTTINATPVNQRLMLSNANKYNKKYRK